MAIRFDGDFNDALDRNTIPDYNGNWTIGGQTYISVDTAANATLWYIGNDTLAAYDELFIDSGRHFAVKRAADTTATTSGATVLTVGQYYHLAAVSIPGSSTIDLYINGVFEVTHSQTIGSRAAPGTAMMLVGARWLVSQPLNGRMADWRIWTTNLTAPELVTEKGSATAVKTASLWADYQMPSDATRDDDFSGNARDLTTHGSIADEADPVYGGPTTPIIVGQRRMVRAA